MTKGEIKAVIDGQAVSFTELLADDNYVMGTGIGLAGTSPETGTRFQVQTMFMTLTLETELPWEVRAETMEEAMERHQTGDRSPPKSVFIRYEDADGRGFYDANPSVTITAFDGTTVTGTFTSTLQEKKGNGRIEVTNGAFEVRVKSPMAAKVVETTVGQ